MILGMSFRESNPLSVYHSTDSITFLAVRNAYMLVNFGDFIDGKEDKIADPYIQLLPTTDDISEAHRDFVNVRLESVDSTQDQTFLDTFNPSGPPDVKKSNSSGFTGWLEKHKTILIAVGASVGGVLLLSLLALCFCCRRRANVREKDGKKKWFLQGTPVGSKGGYKPVRDSYGKV